MYMQYEKTIKNTELKDKATLPIAFDYVSPPKMP